MLTVDELCKMSTTEGKKDANSKIVIYMFIAFFVTQDASCFDIERRVTSKRTVPYPSADRFRNPFRSLCLFRRNSCNDYDAKCASVFSCCTCECRGHKPNFLSTRRGGGCRSTYSLTINAETNCQYTLENSETRYVPTFTSYTDFDARDIKVLLTNDLMHAALSEGHCKASTISYIDKRGQKRKLFENSCSEIFEIEKQIGGAKEVKQLLKWKWTYNPSVYWHKLQGKLLRLEVKCRSATKAFDSCILFKVGGTYDDDSYYGIVESPRVCPKREIYMTTMKPTTKIKRKSTNKQTATIEITHQKTTTSPPVTASEAPVTEITAGPVSEIPPPASLPDVETSVPDSWTNAPVVDTTVAGPSIYHSSDVPATKKSHNRDEGSNAKISANSASNNKHKLNWLVTGLIITVAVLLVILAASLFVLFRKRCQKRAQRNSGEFAMNVVYHGTPATGPEYDEATLPSKRDCDDDEVNCYNDGNLYESIDNLNVKGASADTYEYAFNDADTAKVKLPDENGNKCQEQNVNIAPRPTQNEYAVAFRTKGEHVYHAPVTEEYADMHLAAGEETPLCTEQQSYVNVPDGMRDNAQNSAGSDAVVQSDAEVYEEMESDVAPETEALVPATYVEPDVVSEGK